MVRSARNFTTFRSIKSVQRIIYDAVIAKKSLFSLLSFVIFALIGLFVTISHFFYASPLDDNSNGCRSGCCDNIGDRCEPCEYIDVVYTWVNGSDPLLLESMTKYAKLGGFTEEDDLSPSRFDDKQELKYSLRSLEKYAPWIRQVFIVTAGQLPSWLNVQDNWSRNGRSRLRVISHEDIIPTEYLPTFSSPAIECFLHRIPGLSEKFIYFNDDVLLGDYLYLSDLYTPSDGYIVYTSWSVPECAQGCPWSFLGDNSCDQSCNNQECDYDGGDCIGNPKSNGHNHLDYPADYADDPFFDEDEKSDYNENKVNVERYPGAKEIDNDRDIYHARQIQDGKLLQHLIDRENGRNDRIGIEGEKISLRKLQSVDSFENKPKNNVIYNRRLKSIQIMAPNVRDRYVADDYFRKKLMNSSKTMNIQTSHVPNEQNSIDVGSDKLRNFSNVLRRDINNSSSHKIQTANLLHKSSEFRISEIIKTKKFHNISEFVSKLNSDVLKNNKRERKRNVNMLDGANVVNHDKLQYKERRQLDVYARSLIHTNKIFNKMYGFQNRKVPAHIPFLMEKKTIEKMQQKFEEHIEVTKRNKFRRPNDFQFAFSYYHYMMSEREEYTIEEIFDLFDTDNSGTWSDREVRTVLARVRGPPLTAEAVHALESVAKACDNDEHRSHPTPPNERYLDSDMPTLTKKLVIECPGLKSPLIGALGQRKLRTHPRPATGIATFAMLSSNITKAVIALDDIRKETKKFICINDNLDPSRETESEIVRMVLQELYESLLPLPSRWELPPHVANRFLRLDDLMAWQNSRILASRALMLCAILLLFLTMYQTQCLRFISNKIRKGCR